MLLAARLRQVEDTDRAEIREIRILSSQRCRAPGARRSCGREHS